MKTISITVKDGFSGNVRKPNEFLVTQLGASARSVYTGFAVQMGPVSVLGYGFLFGLGGVLERGTNLRIPVKYLFLMRYLKESQQR